MKTEEFVKKIEKLGCKVTIYDTVIDVSVKDKHLYNPIAQISREVHCRVQTNYSVQERLNEDHRNKLYSIIFEYVLTPLDEREEVKKYYLRLPEFFNEEWAYLNYYAEGNDYFFNDKLLKEDNQTQFTQEEIDKLPCQDFIKTLIKEEVE